MGGTESLQLTPEDWEDELDNLRSEWHKPLYSGSVSVIWQAADGEKVSYFIVLTDTCVLFFGDEEQYKEAEAGKLQGAPPGIELHEASNFLVIYNDGNIRIQDSSDYIYATILPAGENEENATLEDLSDYMNMVVQSSPSNREEASNARFLEAEDSDAESTAEDDASAQGGGFNFHAHQELENSSTAKALNPLITVKNRKCYCKIRNNVLLCYKTAEAMDKNLRPKRTVDLHGAYVSDFLDTDSFSLLPCCATREEDDNKGGDSTTESSGEGDSSKKRFAIVQSDETRIPIKTDSKEDAESWRQSIDQVLARQSSLGDPSNSVSFDEFLEQMRTGDVLMMTGKKFMCRRIRAITGYDYDHAALCCTGIGPDGSKQCLLFDSTGDGVKAHNFVKFRKKKWYLPYAKTVWRKLHVIESSDGSDEITSTETERFAKLDASKCRKFNDSKDAGSDENPVDDFPMEIHHQFIKFMQDNMYKKYSIGWNKLSSARGKRKSNVGSKNDREGMFCSEAVALAYMRCNLLNEAKGAGSSYVPGSFSTKRALALETCEFNGKKYKAQWGEEIEVQWTKTGGGLGFGF